MRISDWSSDVCSSDLVSDGTAANANRRGRDCRFPTAALVVQWNPGNPVEDDDEHSIPLRFHGARGPARHGWHGHRGHRPLRHRSRAHLRSEEHTSELQSLMRISSAVFCLKKKRTINNTPHT